MLLRIITPERVVFEDQIDQVTLHTKDGDITVLQNHVPLASILVPGEALIKKGESIFPLALSSGMIQIKPQEITVLADTAERVEEIIVQQAEEAKIRAEKLLEGHLDAEEFAFVAAKLDRDLNRLRIARKWKHYGHHDIHIES